MINLKYSQAYKEVLEIIKYFPKEEYNKIPIEKIEFYEKNMDRNYEFSINPEIGLDKQKISKEAKAIIVNLYKNYLATEAQKKIIDEILELNEQKLEKQKLEKYNPDDIFKKTSSNPESSNVNVPGNKSDTSLIEYKESFFTRFKNFIFKILHINN